MEYNIRATPEVIEDILTSIKDGRYKSLKSFDIEKVNENTDRLNIILTLNRNDPDGSDLEVQINLTLNKVYPSNDFFEESIDNTT